MHKRWARLYLHFCAKYKHNPADTKSTPLFIKKLASKIQTENQRAQAQAAVEYYRILLLPDLKYPQVKSTKLPERSGQTSLSRSETSGGNPDFVYLQDNNAISSEYETPKFSKLAEPAERFKHAHASTDKARTESNAGWLDLETGLKNEIMLRHYSPRTLKSYQMWMRKFRGFLFNKDPSQLANIDVKQFLTDLAVKKGVSASAQNQASNALLFLSPDCSKRKRNSLQRNLSGSGFFLPKV